MKQDNIKSSIEVYICNFNRDNEESCAGKGAKELTDNLKKWAKEETKQDIRVFRSGCLGRCSEGIAIACYPQKKLLLDVELKDEAELKKGLIEALAEVKA